MDSGAYLLPGMYQITQLSSTTLSVIYLGHSLNVPLIKALSELSDGLEPHGIKYTAAQTAVTCGSVLSGMAAAGGVPGVVYWVGSREGYYTGY